VGSENFVHVDFTCFFVNAFGMKILLEFTMLIGLNLFLFGVLQRKMAPLSSHASANDVSRLSP